MTTPVAAFHIPAAMAAEIVAHSENGFPEEVCGIVAGRDNRAITLHPGRNVSTMPRTSYELDPDTLAMQIDFDAVGLELVGIYHSHPSGPDFPSVTDIAQAYYPDAVYLICSLADREHPTLRGFRIIEGVTTETRLVRTEGARVDRGTDKAS